jgi:uncharacterized spore protein YtfJ
VEDLNLDEVYGGMAHNVKKGFSVGRVFGEPIKVSDDVTIIPVAKVKMGGGGGGGTDRPRDEVKEKKEEESTGGGFGFKGGVEPVGYIKVKGDCVKFVRIHDWEKIALMVPACLMAAGLIKHKMMKMHGMGGVHHKPCPLCGMHHMAPFPMHHMAKHMMMKKMMRAKMMGGPCPHCGMHHMGPCHHHEMAGREHKKKMMMARGRPEDWQKKKKKKWIEAKKAEAEAG